MARKFTESTLIIASHNKDKINEIKHLLMPFNIDVTSSAALGLSEPEETGTTYLENALIKARACMAQTGLPVLSDDSGLEVEALENAPGIDAGPFAQQQGGYEKVFELWSQNPKIQENPNAAFCCTLVLLWPDKHYEIVEGRLKGTLTFPPRGVHGHGYDPIVIPDGYTQTIAEMSLSEKNKCSHRFLALQHLIDACFK